MAAAKGAGVLCCDSAKRTRPHLVYCIAGVVNPWDAALQRGREVKGHWPAHEHAAKWGRGMGGSKCSLHGSMSPDKTHAGDSCVVVTWASRKLLAAKSTGQQAGPQRPLSPAPRTESARVGEGGRRPHPSMMFLWQEKAGRQKALPPARPAGMSIQKSFVKICAMRGGAQGALCEHLCKGGAQFSGSLLRQADGAFLGLVATSGRVVV